MEWILLGFFGLGFFWGCVFTECVEKYKKRLKKDEK
tara:strand:- start:1113 stop:1220 length:108 start_codon:yes stop_codon:yes gene_type:complete